MAECCQASSFGQKASKLMPSVVPAVVLLLVPKCPMCLAACLTVATGLSFSATGAAWLRAGIALLWAAAVAHLVWKRVLMRRSA